MSLSWDVVDDGFMDEPIAEPTTLPPPPESMPAPHPTVEDPPTGPIRFRHPVALFAVAAGIATVIAIAIGTGVGFVAFSSSAASCSPSDGWCGLGAALLGLFVGGAAGLIAYVAAGIVVIRRSRPAGRRSAHIAAHIAFPPAFGFALDILAETIGALT